MADIFGNNISSANGTRLVSSDNVAVKLKNNSVSLANNVTISYQQNVNPNYEIGSATTYYVIGQPSGTAGISLAVGPSSGLAGNIAGNFNGNCEFTPLNVSANSDCVTVGVEQSLSADTFLQSISTTIAAQGLQVGVQLNCILTNLTT